MRKFLIMLGLMGICSISHLKAQITISDARAQGAGATVTVRGVVTNGPGEFTGDLRYFQDPTGGLAAYSPEVSSLVRGDSIEITGELKDFKGLLEMDPVTNVQVIMSGVNVDPKVITIGSGYTEANEGLLVTVEQVSIDGASGTFSGGTNYTINDGSNSGEMRIDNSTNLPSTPVPVTAFTLTGLMGEYQGTYQILPRATTDIGTEGPGISSVLRQTNIAKTGFTVEFDTDNDGNTIVFYGETDAYELGTETDPAMGTSHSIDLTGLTPGTIYHIKAASVGSSNDTSFAAAMMATISESSGEIKVYFNNPVDNSFNFITPAVYLNNSIQDTLIKYIDEAENTLDIAIYNMDDNNGIVDAINNAHGRGVTVRVIVSSDPGNLGYNLLNAGITKMKSKTGQDYGEMHNKFIIRDVDDPAKATVWTGSLNFTNQQILSDPNNVVIIQDQTLAKAYLIEFEELLSNKFGPDKTDNIPHEFVIDGKRVELYFSPSDNTEQKIKDAINNADDDLYLAIFAYTRFGISFEIEDQIDAGIFAAGVVEDTSAGQGFAYSVLANSTNGSSRFFLHDGVPGDMHHKYLIVDPNNGLADPIILTGSHNWSTSANTRNDENTLIIHSQDHANQYFQEFMQRFSDGGGNVNDVPFNPVLGLEDADNADEEAFLIYPNPASGQLNVFRTADQDHPSIIRITNVLGGLVYEDNLTGASNSDRLQIDVQNWSPGVYVLAIENGRQRSSGKFVILPE